ncbi:MAG: phospho-N-acetylmuramoyl-pentapeptide-transferase [Clostridia bacterium]|nr:phospho-N-acetylmuramoyl-pentapeptide-transferase [Clostridia bacterium]
MIKRIILICIISLAITFIFGLLTIPFLRRLKAKQSILKYLKEHFDKSGTPTMGGLFFVTSIVITFFLLSKGEKVISILSCLVFIGFGIVGFLDDFIKVKFAKNEGLTPMQKTLFLIAVAVISAIFSYRLGLNKLYIPFTKKVIDIGFWYIPLCVFVFLATTNCVNLTDGLDGLASSCSAICFLFSAVLILLQTATVNIYAKLDEFHNLSYLSISCVGGLLGFLIFNTHKASVFMGDTGSLALGGLFASIMIFSGNALYIPIIGIMFVLSGISVIIQVGYYKLTKKRVFLMAPLHHHFQHKGVSEPKIVFWYSVVTFLAGLVSIITFV